MSEYKDKWIAALRSGEYKQGQGMLCHVGDGETREFCCLGVLADLDGVLVSDKFAPSERMVAPYLKDGIFSPAMYEGRNGVLRKIVLDTPEGLPAGIYGGFEKAQLPTMVARLNDAGLTFEQIADYLEKVDF